MARKSIQKLFSISEIELVYKNKLKPEDRIKIIDPDQAYDAFLNTWDMNKIDLVEQFKIMLLDRANYCLGIANISTGGISSCNVDPKILFAIALGAKASSIVLAHNHPSGNTKPSKNDEQLTEKIRDGGKLLDIVVSDHIVVTRYGYYSFANQSLIL